jgi:hypothetical protein
MTLGNEEHHYELRRFTRPNRRPCEDVLRGISRVERCE